MNIACERAREVVLGRPPLAEASDEMFRARHHVEMCEFCRQYFAKENHWQIAWKRRMAGGVAAAGLKLRLEKMMGDRSGRSRGWTRSRRWVLAAAVLLAFGAGGMTVWTINRSKRVTIAEELISEFVLNLPQATEIVGASPEDLVEQAEMMLGVRIDPPPMHGMRVESAKICTLMQKAAALIHYRGGGPSCSLYVFNDPGLSLAEWRPGTAGKSDYYSYSKKGINVVMWRQGPLVYTLVSSASPDQMVAMMR